MRPLRKALRALIGLMPFRGRYRLADKLGGWLAGEGPEIVRINGINVALDHRLLLHRLMYYGLYEENVMNFLRGHLRPGDVVLDPGANIGYFAARCLGFVGERGQVHSFEPSRSAYAHLHAHNASGAPPNWHLEHAAITDHSGEMTFYDTPRVMTMGFACLEGTFEPKDRIPHPVRVYALDDHCRQRNINAIAFLKLDIEGSELQALRGAEDLFQRRAIRAVLVETTVRPDLRPTMQAIDDLLRAAGFTSHRVRQDGSLVPLNVMAHDQLREDVLWTLATET